MLFFQLKINQKLSPILCLAFILFLASCHSSKKVSARRHKPRTHKVEKVVEVEREEIRIEAAPPREEKIEANEGRADKVIDVARHYIGTPYKYGGTTRSGMDCSGLLLNSFKAIEVNLPRSSEAQSHVGKEVKHMNDLEPGDLVFFATGNKRNEITHVGMVTDVRSKDNIKFIHSSSSLGVVETNLYAEYYQKRYRGARRVISRD